MQISKEQKIRLFDLVLFYGLPLTALSYLTSFLFQCLEMAFLPSEKDSWIYLLTFQVIAVGKVGGGLALFGLHVFRLEPFSRPRLQPAIKSLLLGLVFGATITGFFFVLSAYQPGYAEVPPQGWVMAWDVLVFRYLPIYVCLGSGLEILLGTQVGMWAQLAWVLVVQLLWSAATELLLWSGGDHVFDWRMLYPMTSVCLAIALQKKWGILAGAFVIIANGVAYQILLYFGKFPIPSHLNSSLTILMTLGLIRAAQSLAESPRFQEVFLRPTRFRSIAIKSSRPELGESL